jgi:hypothetical protein
MEHNQSNFGLDQCHDCGVRRKQVANPTTNYGFVLPTPTDLVTDLPADFDVALQGVDTRLKALQPGTTLGDLAYSSATANTNTRLAIGSTGDVLTVAGGVPTWAAPAGGGKVLQVVSATYSTSTTIASTTLTDSGLSASITPSATSSKIYVIAINKVYAVRDTTLSGSKGALLRGSTIIANMSDYTTRSVVAGSGATQNGLSLPVVQMALDSPNTTSSTTYKTQFAAETTSNSGQVIVQEASSIATIILMEIGV